MSGQLNECFFKLILIVVFASGVGLTDRSEEVEEEKWGKMEKEETRIRHIVPLTTDPSTTIGFTDPSWDWLEKTTPLPAQRSEVRGGGITEVFPPDSDFRAQQVHLHTVHTYMHRHRTSLNLRLAVV